MTEVSIKALGEIVEPVASAMGFEVVRVAYGGSDRPVLQVMAERPDGTMTVEDCAKLSRELSVVLDVENPVSGRYELEVISPGIDRPLTRLKDFEDFRGFEAKVETRTPIDGQKRFRGRVLGTEGDRIKLMADAGDLELLFDDIEKAKLILTDELVAASLKGQ